MLSGNCDSKAFTQNSFQKIPRFYFILDFPQVLLQTLENGAEKIQQHQISVNQTKKREELILITLKAQIQLDQRSNHSEFSQALGKLAME